MSTKSEKKLRRGKVQPPVENPLNVDFFALEEIEAKSRDVNSDVERFKVVCETIRKNMAQINTLAESDHESSQAHAEMAKLKMETCFAFAELKKLNRLDKHRLKAAREDVNEQKQKVDTFHLQLQNLMYEAMHLQKEVKKCMEFRSKDEEIDVVSADEFLKNAPSDITAPFRDKDNIDNHQLTLARLQWELEQRKTLASRLKETLVDKEKFQGAIRKKQEVLGNIQPTLKSILEATQPLYSELGMSLQVNQPEHQNAQFLSRPLYVLYVETSAFCETYGKLFDVSVDGNVEEARAMQSTDENEMERNGAGDESGDSDVDDSKKAKRHHRSGRETSMNDVMSKVFKAHPLRVVLSLTHEGN